MIADAALAVLFAVFIWWFSTGVVLLLNGLHRRAQGRSLVLSSLLALAALYALAHTSRQSGVAAAYCAFTSALLIWGWLELSFLTGWIVGPRRVALPKALAGWPRFRAATALVLWHELAILGVGGLVAAVTWGAPNRIGLWTFLVLWAMRTSAKLNLFFGVRNHSEAFLPPALAYLHSGFRRRAMNPLFPLTVVAASLVLALLLQQVIQLWPQAPAVALGHLLVATLLALAIVEHAMLVLPLDTTALWRWALARRALPR